MLLAFLHVSRPDRHTDQVADTAQFVYDYARALGADIEQTGAHRLRVELSRDQLCTLEGHTPNTWYATSSLPEWATMYWQLTPPGTPGMAQDSRYENAALGSRRLGLIRQSAATIGAVTRLRAVPTLPAPRPTYRTIAIIGFEIAYFCASVRHTLLPVAVDTVTGTADEAAAVNLLSRTLDEAVPSSGQRQKRRLTYRRVFAIACDYVKKQLSADASLWQWYEKAKRRYTKACHTLEDHCNACRAQGDDDIADGDMDRWQRELKSRYAPRVEATPSLGMIVSCPVAELPRQLL